MSRNDLAAVLFNLLILFRQLFFLSFTVITFPNLWYRSLTSAGRNSFKHKYQTFKKLNHPPSLGKSRHEVLYSSMILGL
jgi:hypothetical protein